VQLKARRVLIYPANGEDLERRKPPLCRLLRMSLFQIAHGILPSFKLPLMTKVSRARFCHH
jgi:hypothetical protein